jgi:hypothetical protein
VWGGVGFSSLSEKSADVDFCETCDITPSVLEDAVPLSTARPVDPDCCNQVVSEVGVISFTAGNASSKPGRLVAQPAGYSFLQTRYFAHHFLAKVRDDACHDALPIMEYA